MINAVTETIIRTTTKIDPSSMINEKQIDQQKAEQAKQTRPVEDSESGSKTENKTTQGDSSKYLLQGHKLVFEKYNKAGDVVLRIPSSDAPVDEMA